MGSGVALLLEVFVVGLPHKFLYGGLPLGWKKHAPKAFVQTLPQAPPPAARTHAQCRMGASPYIDGCQGQHLVGEQPRGDRAWGAVLNGRRGMLYSNTTRRNPRTKT
jgi:hypothetical protein